MTSTNDLMYLKYEGHINVQAKKTSKKKTFVGNLKALKKRTGPRSSIKSRILVVVYGLCLYSSLILNVNI